MTAQPCTTQICKHPTIGNHLPSVSALEIKILVSLLISLSSPYKFDNHSKLHQYTNLRPKNHQKWPVVQPAATATARVCFTSWEFGEGGERMRVRANMLSQTSLTPSQGSTVVSQTQRLRSSIWDERRPVSMSSHSASTWFPTSMSNFPPRPWKPPVSAPTDT